jgi:hypothetical protein
MRLSIGTLQPIQADAAGIGRDPVNQAQVQYTWDG